MRSMESNLKTLDAGAKDTLHLLVKARRKE